MYGASAYSSTVYADIGAGPGMHVGLPSLLIELFSGDLVYPHNLYLPTYLISFSEGSFSSDHSINLPSYLINLNYSLLQSNVVAHLPSYLISFSEGTFTKATRNPGLSLTNLKVVSSIPSNNNDVALRVSLNRGATWGNEIVQSMGSAGQYATSISYRQLGMGRDAVFELSWSSGAPTALIGANLIVSTAGT